jgi:tetrapyrrole methylase family protein/MazG family protein
MTDTRFPLTIVGLGPGDIGLISLQTLDVLRGAARVILRTGRHPAAEKLADYGVRFTSCDDLYDTHGTFDDVYAAVTARVAAAAAAAPTVYAVPGDPLVAERTVMMLRARADLSVTVLPALGALNLLLARLGIDPGDGLRVADARDEGLRPRYEAPTPEEHAAYHGAAPFDPGVPTLWLQVDTPLVAGNLKILLLEAYPPDHPVTVLTAVGAAEEAVETVALADLDRGPAITHLTSLFVPALPWQARRHTVQDLLAIMALLRSERGCPWDRAQDLPSLRHTIIEEAYEVAEAIDRDNPDALADECGDLLLNIIFVAQLGMEEGVFDFDDVVGALADKLIRRHTHVFGEAEAENPNAVLRNWEQIKVGERAEKGETRLFDDVPLALPALARAQKLQKRAARVGFDWRDFRGPLAKLHEELLELSEEVGVPESWPIPAVLAAPLAADPAAAERASAANPARVTHEIGDLLFAAVNLCRFLHLDAEETLREANARFTRRFYRVEDAVHARGQRVEALALEELDQVWLAVKGDD